jgi:ATP-dependent RNA helicase RhlE
MTFHELGLAEPILRAVTKEGYTTPTPIQGQTIPHLVEGKDVLGCAPTGTGKTAAFALPILHRLAKGKRPETGPRPIRALLLTPTRELAAQIDQAFYSYGHYTSLRGAVIYGGVGYQPQVMALRRGVDILIATPGRLVDLMNQGLCDFSKVEIFVLDEADRMLDMGFEPDLRKIMAVLPKAKQSVLFSATMPREIEQLARAMLKNPVHVTIAKPKEEVGLIEEVVRHVPQKIKPQLLVHMLSSDDVNRTLVFTRTKHGADRVVKHLSRAGIQAEALHGNKTQASRLRTLNNLRNNRTKVVVATDVAARGIDVDNISHVFNYDLPHEPETYVHRIGRTGRAGATGMAISFCDMDEQKFLRNIERLTKKRIPVDRSPLPEFKPEPKPVLQEREVREVQPPRHAHEPRQGQGHGKRPKHKRNEKLVSSPKRWH